MQQLWCIYNLLSPLLEKLDQATKFQTHIIYKLTENITMCLFIIFILKAYVHIANS